MTIIITDTNLEKLVADKYDHPIIAIPPGEKYKTRETKAWIEDELLKRKCGRDTTLLAIGGGVVLDIAGFVAATYMRGIPYISIPTTLLAMVDASIGGKTGVNTPFGKNSIGAFYPPLRTEIDLTWLETLPSKEWTNGYAEIVKCAFIHNPNILTLDLPQMIESSIKAKKEIVAQDPKEKGLRRILNFGHTIGHALELLTHFKVSHGEAVFFGMLVESGLSHALGFLSKTDLEDIKKILFSYCPSFSFSLDPSWDWIETMSCDKKAIVKKPRIVLLDKMGSVCNFKGEYCAECPYTSLEISYYARACLGSHGKRQESYSQLS